MNPLALPALDAIPLPAPVWLLKVLLWVTFLGHVVFMNLTLGGALLATVCAFRGREKDKILARSLAKGLPYTMAFTITFAIPPLLFVQTLYGPLFYSSTILLAVPFLFIVPTLILAYYGIYLLAMRWSRLGKTRGWIAAAVVLLLGAVAWTNGHVLALMNSPGLFRDLYLASASGAHLHVANSTVLPRFFHVLFGAIAVAGLFTSILGTRRLKMEPELGRWIVKTGVRWFIAATVVNVGMGLWWLLALPSEALMTFMGRNLPATIAFIAALVFTLAAAVLALKSVSALKPVPRLMGAVHALAGTLACMIFMRDALRDVLLAPAYDVWSSPTRPQWGAIALFLFLFVSGGAACAWLLRLAAVAARAKRERGDDENRGPGLTDSGLHRLSAEDSQAFRGGLVHDSGIRPPP